MRFGLSRDTVMCLAYKIVDKAKRNYPFKDEKAGRAWFYGFHRRHPKLTILPSLYHTAELCVQM